jgi:hypothetical protein
MIKGKRFSRVRRQCFLTMNANRDKSLKMTLTFSDKMMMHFNC